jgi:deazaflavin-dependent oxidoreductase (nitroreductase family)
MWFMNHIWNPIVRFILRSPLHGVMSKSLMLITYRGEKSGKEYTLPVSFLEDGGKIYVIPGSPEKKVWWHNIHSNMSVSLTVRGKVIQARGNRLTPEGDLKTISRILELFIRKNPPVAALYNVRRSEDGKLILEDLKNAAGKTVMVRFSLNK